MVGCFETNNTDDGDDYDYYDDDDDDVPSKGSINHSTRYSTFALSSTLLLIWNLKLIYVNVFIYESVPEKYHLPIV